MSERPSVDDAIVNAANCHLLFERLIEHCEKREAFPVAVCWPCSRASLAGAMEAAKAGIFHSLLVGPERELNAIAASLVERRIEDKHMAEVARCAQSGIFLQGRVHQPAAPSHPRSSSGRRISTVLRLGTQQASVPASRPRVVRGPAAAAQSKPHRESRSASLCGIGPKFG